MSPTFSALAIRNYRIYIAGSVVSNVGTWMQRIAQDWLVLQLTHSGTAVGVTTGLQFLPAMLLSPIAGVVADRVPKRTVLRFTNVAMAVPAAVLGLLAVTGLVQAWEVYLLTFLFGVGTAFDAPARQSFVVEIVGKEDLSNAVGLNSAAFNLARLVGPALAGGMIAALGSGVRAAGWVIVLNAVSYVGILVSLQLLDGSRLHPSPITGTRKGAVRDGVAYVRSRPDLVLVFTSVFFVGTFGLNFQMTNALMSTQVFHRGAGEYGALASITAIGSLGGAFLAARRRRPRLLFVVVAGLAFSVLQIASGLMPSFITFAALLPALGLTSLTMVNSANAMMQLSTSPAMRGRVAALYLMILMGGTPVGAPVLGWVGQTFGARWMLVGGGTLSLVGLLIGTGWYLYHQEAQRTELRARARDLRWRNARRANVHGVEVR